MSVALLDNSLDVLLDAAGEIVVVDDAPISLSYGAIGNTQASSYTFELVDPYGNLLADLSNLCTTRHFVVRRNRAETISLSMDQGQLESLCTTLGTTVRGLLAPGVNEIRVKRGSRYLFGTQCQYLQAALDGDKRTIDVRAVGFLEVLKDRFLYPSDTLTYAATDIGAIAWNFINATQSRTNGSFGFTQGTIQPSHLIGDTWKPYATNIRDILIALTQRINSIDFDFSYDKKFNVYYPGIGSVKNELRFSYPGNIKSLKLPVDASELATLVFARGSGNGDQQVIRTYPATSTAEQAVYTLREVIDDYPSINVEQTLIDKASEHYRKNATPTTIPALTLDGNIEPYLGAYWIGDSVPLSVDKKAGSVYAPLDGQVWRVNEIDVTIDENDSENIALKVGLS